MCGRCGMCRKTCLGCEDKKCVGCVENTRVECMWDAAAAAHAWRLPERLRACRHPLHPSLPSCTRIRASNIPPFPHTPPPPHTHRTDVRMKSAGQQPWWHIWRRAVHVARAASEPPWGVHTHRPPDHMSAHAPAAERQRRRELAHVGRRCVRAAAVGRAATVACAEGHSECGNARKAKGQRATEPAHGLDMPPRMHAVSQINTSTHQ